MLKPSHLLLGTLLSCSVANAQIFQRELGDFDLKLGTTPSRSMAQGLVKPASTGSFHGGLDLSHDSGFYAGQWAPSMGLSPGANLEVDSYLGGNQPFGIGISMKYTTHQLNTPASVDGGYIGSFTDWSVQLSRPFMGVDLNLIYSDSSLSGSDCSAYSGHNSQCDGLVTLKAERPFY